MIKMCYNTQVSFLLYRCLVYILFQSAGAIAGAGLLKTTVPDSYVGTLGVVAPGEGVSSMEALGAEIIITFLLLFATLAMVSVRFQTKIFITLYFRRVYHPLLIDFQYLYRLVASM